MPKQTQKIIEEFEKLKLATKEQEENWICDANCYVKENRVTKKEVLEKALSQQKEEIKKMIDEIYPPVFIKVTKYGEGTFERGKQTGTGIIRLTKQENEIISNILSLIK